MIKYRIPYFDKSNNSWRVELSTSSYTGDPITLNTTEGQGCTISHVGSQDPFEPVIVSNAKFTILKHNLGLVDVKEFKNSYDKDWSVDVYKNNSLFWTGYLTPDGIQEYYQSLPYDVELTATDGLKLLQGTTYVTNNWPLPTGVTNRSFISHIRDILFNSNQLGKPLPIHWVGYLKQSQSGGILNDAFTDCTYSPSGEGYTDFNGNKYSSYFIMDNYLRALQSRIYQFKGKWVVERINDIRTGTFNYIEMSTEYDGTSIPTLTSGTETRTAHIGALPGDIDDGAYTLNLPGLKRVTVTYENGVGENVMPNGTFDSALFAPIQWHPSNSDVTIQRVDSINGRAGKSLEVTFPADSPGWFRVEDLALRQGTGGVQHRLPIDTATIYKRMSLGFTLMPQNGFPYSASDGSIQWDLKPFVFRIELTKVTTFNIETIYTLNENGFWIPKPTGGDFQRFGYGGVTSGSNYVMSMHFTGNSIVGDWINYSLNGAEIVRVNCPQQYSNDLIGFLNYAGQYMVDNGGGNVLSFNVSGSPSDYLFNLIVDGHGSGQTHVSDFGQSTSNRDGSINLLPESGSRVGDVIQINFDKFQGVKLPDFATDPNFSHCELNWFFYVKQGQRYTLDDVYVTLDENNEVYDYEYTSSRFTANEDYTQRIGTSKNGMYKTNVMSAFFNSVLEAPYIDTNGYTGTLADITARTIIRYRSKSLEMFEGVLLGDNFEFGTIYTIEGFDSKKMLPLSASYNTESGTTQVTLVELNLGDESFTRKFYGSNDKPLSNEIIN